ncbi:unnamed protein product [Brachionus calyciflorus]|uniref:Calponin-homology (CH) domain-containing protein n=1 Tax=Brachionus calyciflorus TaxID=104777 RepID=A0A814A5A4_9BILA|nr:unnamed protein product [Brachionus calyciflorus]
MLKIIKKAISGNNSTNHASSSQSASNENSPVQNNAYQNNAMDSNSFLDNQFQNPSQNNQINGMNYNIATYNSTSFNPNTMRKAGKSGHSENGTFNMTENIQTHPQSRSLSIAHRNNGYNNSPVTCLPQGNMNFSNTPQPSPSPHLTHNIPLANRQFYSQNQSVIPIKKPSTTTNPDIEYFEQQSKLSQQKYQELENQFKNQTDQIKDLKGTIQSLNDMNHKFYDEIQHLKERNLEQRKQIESFNKLFQDCKQDSERKLSQMRQELEQSVKRELEFKKMIQQIQDSKNQEINGLKEKLERAKMTENHLNNEIEKKKAEIQIKTEKIELLEKNIQETEKNFNLFQETSISEKKNFELNIENLKHEIDVLNRKADEEKKILSETSTLEKNEQKKHLDELEQKLEQIIKEKAEITCQYAQIFDRNKELNEILKTNDENNEKKLKDSMSQSEIYKTKCANLEKELNDLRDGHAREKEEWKKFQADLQTAVRVANDFMNEAEEKYNKIRDELLNTKEMNSLSLEDKLKPLVDNNPRPNGEKKILTQNEIEIVHKSKSNKNLMEPIESNNFQTNTDTDDAKILSFNQINNGQYSFQKRVSATSNDLSPSLLNSNNDSLGSLIKQYGVSRRNALMKWCQERLYDYEIEIKNFSTSWGDGLAFCALLHSFLPQKIDYENLKKEKNVRKRLTTAFSLAESIGIEQKLNINDILSQDRPDWNEIMNYVALIYAHFTKNNQTNDEIKRPSFGKIFDSPKSDKSFTNVTLTMSNSSSNITNNK